MGTPPLRVLFRAAAGPRLGFGHLVRCRSLARALGVTPRVSLRATARTREAAVRLGCTLADDGTKALRASALPCVMVVDDPSAEHAEAWVNRARRLGVPVATVHDLGLGYVPADLGIDGSLRPQRGMRGRWGDLRGPRYAMLDPSVALARDRRSTDGCPSGPPRLLIALGGGNYVFGLAARLSEAVAMIAPGTQVRIAAGFSEAGRLPALPYGEWVAAPHGLADELAQATVTLVAGGVTLYEACAIGTPAIALALTPAQGVTIRAIANAGAAIDGGSASRDRDLARLASHVAHLLGDPRRLRRMTAAGQTLVDGRGIYRVADAVRDLAAWGLERRHAA